MKRLLDQENIGGRIRRWWSHTGDYGETNLTAETVQDVEPVFKEVKRQSEAPRGDFAYRGTIPFTILEESARQSALIWGCSVREAFAEIMGGKTDRAQAVLRIFFEGRDYRKFQADKSQRYINGTTLHKET